MLTELRTRMAQNPDRTAWRILSVAAGALFVIFGPAKFTAHEQAVLAPYFAHGALSPLHSLLGTQALAYALGVVETALGLLLLSGFYPRLAGLVLTGFALGTLSMLVFKPPAHAALVTKLTPGFFVKDLMLLALGVSLLLGFGSRTPAEDRAE